MIIVHDGILVVRDDLFPGGTKARYLGSLFKDCDEVVYASPVQGGAQTALAHVARDLDKRVTIVCAKRAVWHPRTALAASMGAHIIEVSPGYLNVVQSRAREYCDRTGAKMAPFGMDIPEAATTIVIAAHTESCDPQEVWCAAGSGVLARALQAAWPDARLHAVEVGRTLSFEDVGGAIIHHYGRSFNQHAKTTPPFPSDPHYDAKAWEICVRDRTPGARVLFWNVTGPA
jgi:hypothetical protein